MTLPFWRPSVFAKRRAALMLRARLFAAARRYFAAQGFTEVDVPALQVSPGLEPHLHAFATEYELPHGGTQRLYLHTSPEFTCKKLLAAGMERIYALQHVYRNREGSSRHHPEFMMLEWYRAHEEQDALMRDCMALLRAAQKEGGRRLRYRGVECDAGAEPEVLTMQEAFARHAGMDLLATMDDAGNPSPDKLAAAARQAGVRVAEKDRWDDIALAILAEKIEPRLGLGHPAFLTGYPLCMAALARPDAGDARLARRFELYVCGMELANAFEELTDADAQRKRFQSGLDLKKSLYGTHYPMDEDFLEALRQMPPASGIALGMDRLVMLAAGEDNITGVLWAPVRGQ